MINLLTTTQPFALIRRQAENNVLCLSGSVAALDKLADIPRRTGAAPQETFDTLSILPFRQVEELGFQARHNNEKILCMTIESQESIARDELLALLPNETLTMDGEGAFTPDDAGFAAMVQRIITNEIGNGEGCSFVVPRTYKGRIASFDRAKALSVFSELLENEYGTYWTFLYFTGDRYFIGATPERHLSVQGGNVKMNPISGTFRKMEHDRAEALPAMQAFLGDQKEIFELLMVVDEELKMMAEICSAGGQVVGPLIKEMSKLIHTEYVLVGQSDQDVVDMLRESMFATTVVGAPIENACRINYRHNENSRSYYGSALALLGRDASGDTLDSPITIRMAEIALDGAFSISAGATIVRDSNPESETAETTAKARGMLAALGFRARANDPTYRLGGQVYNEDMMIKLSSRNAKLSRFWIEDQSDARHPDPRLMGKKVTIIDNEDHFTRMLAHMIRPLGMIPKIVPNADYDAATDDADLIVLGPGPGDPRDLSDARIAKATVLCRDFLAAKKPLFCVCLGHQILCNVLGLPLVKKQRPFQGAQERIDLFGEPERVGFYNTFAGKVDPAALPRDVEVSFDAPTGEIHALRSTKADAPFLGLQFHPESILTTNGVHIIRDVIMRLMK
ncbi:MAG TPA: phenazine-specific anthranilate synthase component I [Rhodospirillaceae bacterium]|nr:phenazine-specific anthranilate synthase component I [Rhodospirillaceae bacterium]